MTPGKRVPGTMAGHAQLVETISQLPPQYSAKLSELLVESQVGQDIVPEGPCTSALVYLARRMYIHVWHKHPAWWRVHSGACTYCPKARMTLAATFAVLLARCQLCPGLRQRALLSPKQTPSKPQCRMQACPLSRRRAHPTQSSHILGGSSPAACPLPAGWQKMRCSLCKSSWRRCGRRACERSTWRGTTSRLASGCCLARTRRPCSGGPAPAFHTGVPATCCPRAQWLLGPPSQHGRMRRRGSRLRLYEPICRCRAGIYAARSCQDVALSHAKRPSFTISLTD